MTLDEAMAALEAAGKPNTVKIYRRHGITGPCLGVAYSALEKLRKQIKKDHALARELWDSGVHDAQILATKVADPKALTDDELRSWVAQCADYVVTDAVSAMLAKRRDALTWARHFVDDDGEFQSSVGWNLVATLAQKGKLDESEAESLLGRIERELQDAENRTRYAMNGALIAMGGAMPGVHARAVAAAETIGVVEVDRGETGCKTPDAIPYMEKMRARKRSR